MSDKKFDIGDKIRLLSAKSKGEIVDGPNKKGQYLVLHGNFKVWVDAEQISKISTKELKKHKKPLKKYTSSNTKKKEVDYHGYRLDEALADLEKEIDNALLNNIDQIHVIHGIGSGKLQKGIISYLEQSGHVSSFKKSISNPGVIILYL